MSDAARPNPIHLQVGRERKVAVVFSCPGRHEEEAGHPAARNTGRNLSLLLELLGLALRRDDLTRENVTITNAWPEVEYRARTGRSEASVREIRAPGNIARLARELNGITDFVIFCGERARRAASCLTLARRPRFVYVEHLGLRGLSSIRRDVRGEPIVAGGPSKLGRSRRCGNTRKRLEVLAASIVRQLGGEG